MEVFKQYSEESNKYSSPNQDSNNQSQEYYTDYSDDEKLDKMNS